MGRIPLHVGSHKSVPDEPIGVLDLVEEPNRVVEIKEGGIGGETKESASSECVLDEASDGHLGMDLKEFSGIPAFLKVGFKDGEIDGGFNARVSM